MDELINLLRTSFLSDAIEIQECIDLLVQSIEGCRASIKGDMDQAFGQKDYERIRKMTNYLEQIDEIQNSLSQYSDELQVDEDLEESFIKESMNNKNLPAYSELLVDTNIPHSLYDDYTYKRPAAFNLAGLKREVKEWKDLFVQTCIALAVKDQKLFASFVDDEEMQGRKVKYFSKDSKELRSPRAIGETGVYIMTNMSANQIRNTIEKMLRKYGIKVTEYQIFLKADYTPRH